ncbi:hypothetical protein FM038_019665 [Shewanella eurypsychrophilus]|uniref:DUF91 domain-containing protein n=1 Tax=Shewanella eurypsychrophilus TaxID=2593656 RepID=A0ABX6V9L7_9GAMM|nr:MULTISPECIES: hypothetical protein [Shewanella]QFU24146.1 hypothetical protein FS418_21390 [Shewanella sp. YLB-09]QPG59353.1 hypothetical protein FM038_019665 [Shewanella eurypsychrophilus]
MAQQFTRKFSFQQLAEQSPLWWQELLLRLNPTGEELSSNGLRLAVRENYLNFYHKGQAIAKVGFNQKKQLYCEQHIKYVFEGARTQKYLRLTAENRTLTNPERPEETERYLGGETLDLWIERSKQHKGDEKTFVEQVAAENSNVIDMEMGLPGDGYRIDLVALEQHGEEVRLVFWEAKLTTDSRCRTNSETPEVIEQLANYREFLTGKNRPQELKHAYVVACQVLVKITELAGKSVAPIIRDVAKEVYPLVIDHEPRLLLYHNSEADVRNSWSRHEEKLRENKVVLQVMTDKTDRQLFSKEMC